MKDGQKFIGLDVSKDIIAVGITDEGKGAPRFHGNIQNTPEAIRKLFKKLGDPEKLLVCYEAGSCGYSIYRQLLSMDIECIVVAPTLIPKRTGDRVKTDRRDSLRLSQLFRAGELAAVWVPDEIHEALRDLIHARSDFEYSEMYYFKWRVSYDIDNTGKIFGDAFRKSCTFIFV